MTYRPAVPCLECGEPTRHGSRCETCDTARARITERIKSADKATTTQRGYGTTWQRLSRRARARQPWCSECGATDDLQTDHTPEAWKRYNAGKPIRLQDVRVLCGPCNRAAGAARGQNVTRTQ